MAWNMAKSSENYILDMSAMKKHHKIRSDARKAISSSNLLKLLPAETRKSIEKSTEKEDMGLYKKMESKSLKRKKFLAQEYSQPTK